MSQLFETLTHHGFKEKEPLSHTAFLYWEEWEYFTVKMFLLIIIIA